MSDTAPERYGLLDLWRGLLLLAMCAYHLVYDLALFGLCEAEILLGPGLRAMPYLVGGGFILLSGISCRLSRSNLRRGLITLCAGLLVIAATALAGEPVLFGILQLLGLCMLLYGLFGRYLERLPGAAVYISCALLFALTFFLTQSVKVNITWLFPLGFVTEDFFSADYYPLLPWAFLFLFGTRLGGRITENPPSVRLSGALTWPGRHSLIIYLLHQPVICAAVWAVSRALPDWFT